MQFSSNILTMSRQMRALVEQMLELARADSGQGKTDLRPVDLSTLVADALLPFEPVFLNRGWNCPARSTMGSQSTEILDASKRCWISCWTMPGNIPSRRGL